MLDLTGNGATDYFLASDAAIFTLPDGEWCWAQWLNFPSDPSNSFSYWLSNGSIGSSAINLFMNGTSFVVNMGSNLGASVSDISNGKPWFVAVQREASGNHFIKVCQPGDTSVTSSGTGTPPTSVDGGDVYFGSRADLSSTRFFQGEMGEFFKGDFSLTDAEIVAIANGLHPLRLRGDWDFWWPGYVDTGGNQVAPISGLTLTRNGTPGTAPHAPTHLPGAIVVGGVAAGGGSTHEDAGSLAAQMDMTGATDATFETAATLSASVDLTADGNLVIDGAGSLGAGLALTGTDSITLEDSGALSVALNLTGSPNLVMAPVGVLAAEMDLTGSGGLALDESGTLAIDLDVSGASELVKEAAGALGLSVDVQGTVLAEIEGAASLGVSAGLSATAGAVLNVSALLALEASITGVSALAEGSGAPDQRTFAVTDRVRNITVKSRGNSITVAARPGLTITD